jgi:hypothetical protein
VASKGNLLKKGYEVVLKNGFSDVRESFLWTSSNIFVKRIVPEENNGILESFYKSQGEMALPFFP